MPARLTWTLQPLRWERRPARTHRRKMLRGLSRSAMANPLRAPVSGVRADVAHARVRAQGGNVVEEQRALRAGVTTLVATAERQVPLQERLGGGPLLDRAARTWDDRDAVSRLWRAHGKLLSALCDGATIVYAVKSQSTVAGRGLRVNTPAFHDPLS
jgi:hypothetical protein